MTALPSGLRPRGLTWSVLTTHRTVVRVYLALLAVGAASLIGLYLFGEHIDAKLASCEAAAVPCDSDVFESRSAYDFWSSLAAGAIAYLPVVVAAFAGAALIGREMESGTVSWAWTQSFSPLRWFAAKLSVPVVLLIAGMAVLTPLYRWLWTASPAMSHRWFRGEVFLAAGPTATAYVLFGLAFGALAGLLVRRALPALALSVVVTGIVQLLGHVYRPELWRAKTVVGAWPLELPLRAQILDSGGVLPSGRRFAFDRCFENTRGPGEGIRGCLEKYDAEAFTVYHPISHYWPLQLVETGIVLALAAVLTATAFWLLRRRTAADRQEGAA